RLLPALAGGQATGAFGAFARGEALLAGPRDAEAIVLVRGGATAMAQLLDASDASLQPLQSIDPLRSYLAFRPSVDDESGGLRAGESSASTQSAEQLPHGESSPGWPPPEEPPPEEPPPGEPMSGDVQTGSLAACVAVAAESVGVCERALQMTLAYVKERRQFDTPVGAFQAVSHRCAEMLLHTEQARSAVYQAAWAADAEPSLLPAAASLAKALASEAVIGVTASAIQAHGGIGFTWEADVHWLYKRAQMNAALMGGAGEHRRRLAAAIGLLDAA
ncbi:MAG: acyl-CoA dehydrogenase family protein, partial [Solirubrobacteraceae bacterium]